MPTNSLRRKQLIELVPEGLITSRKWLIDHNFSKHALDNMVKSGQLEAIGKGIYVRSYSRISWQAVVFALQGILNKDLVLGGLTALELQGLAHYLPLSNKTIVHLYGNDQIPTWVNTILPDVSFERHPISELAGAKNNQSHAPLDGDQRLYAFTVQRSGGETDGSLILSSPERALLEVLTDVPDKISFEHADQLMQGMTTLSPRTLQKLLELCNNVKVRRLFFWLAERQNYPWLAKINRSTISLGSGNRVLAKGGKLNKKYLITVPDFYE